jgi:hypothetical protein
LFLRDDDVGLSALLLLLLNRSGVTRRKLSDKFRGDFILLWGMGTSLEGDTTGSLKDFGWAVGRSISSVTMTILIGVGVCWTISCANLQMLKELSTRCAHCGSGCRPIQMIW